MPTVIYAEDDADIAVLVTFSLEDHGIDVEVCPDGRLVLERLRDGPRPDALILDVMLPGMSGLEILAEVRGMPEFADLPVLVLSALVRESEREEIRRSGAAAFLTKPFDCEELAALVSDLIQMGDAAV
jgi:DNA-binding response OmpR family regulator